MKLDRMDQQNQKPKLRDLTSHQLEAWVQMINKLDVLEPYA